MSTKAIERALMDMANSGAGPQPRMAAEALASLEAIRKAAKIISKAVVEGWPTTEMGSLNLQHSFEVLGAIAKEAP